MSRSNPVCPPRDAKLALKYAMKQWEDATVAVADVLAADNGRFDRDRFYRAAGLSS